MPDPLDRYRQDEPDQSDSLPTVGDQYPDEEPSQTPPEPPSQPDPYQPSYQPSGNNFRDNLRYVREKQREWGERLAERRAKQAGLQGVEKKALAKGGQQLTGQVASQAGKQAAKAAVRQGAARALATRAAVAASGALTLGTTILIAAGLYVVKKYGKYLIVAIGTLLLLPTIIFSLIFMNFGPPIPPSTDEERAAATSLAAYAGDPSALRQASLQVEAAAKTRYQKIQSLANQTWGVNSPEANRVASEIKKINALNEQLSAETNRAKKKELKNQIVAAKHSFESGLPFGEWIAKIAERYAKEATPSMNFCVLTGNENPRRGCANVVTKILKDAGVPQELCAATMCIWTNPLLATIVSPLPNKRLDRNLWSQNKNKIQRGDIVWWGNGGSATYKSLFNHVGIYVGNDMTVDNSSDRRKVVQRRIDDYGRVFNGAKRYAP